MHESSSPRFRFGNLARGLSGLSRGGSGEDVVCGQRPDGQPCRNVGGAAPWLTAHCKACSPSWAICLGDVGAIDGTFWLLAVGCDMKRIHRVPLHRGQELVVLLVALIFLLSLAAIHLFPPLLDSSVAQTVDYARLDKVTDVATLAVWLGCIVVQWLKHGCAMASWLAESLKQCFRQPHAPVVLHCATQSNSLPAWAVITACKLVLPWVVYPSSSLGIQPVYYALIAWHSAVALLTLLLITLSLNPKLPGSPASYKLGRDTESTAAHEHVGATGDESGWVGRRTSSLRPMSLRTASLRHLMPKPKRKVRILEDTREMSDGRCTSPRPGGQMTICTESNLASANV